MNTDNYKLNTAQAGHFSAALTQIALHRQGGVRAIQQKLAQAERTGDLPAYVVLGTVYAWNADIVSTSAVLGDPQFFPDFDELIPSTALVASANSVITFAASVADVLASTSLEFGEAEGFGFSLPAIAAVATQDIVSCAMAWRSTNRGYAAATQSDTASFAFAIRDTTQRAELIVIPTKTTSAGNASVRDKALIGPAVAWLAGADNLTAASSPTLTFTGLASAVTAQVTGYIANGVSRPALAARRRIATIDKYVGYSAALNAVGIPHAPSFTISAGG